MENASHRAHPFMPNSTEAARAELLQAIGAASVEELFEQIPQEHRLLGGLGLPPPLTSEAALRRHLHETLSKNVSCEDALSFLGGGVWRHHVPAVCDEIVRRSEFLTPVWGTPSSDHGRNQVWFEFQSQLGELVDMDLVALPVYSWGCAAGHALRMAARMTGRRKVVIPRVISPERRAVIASYCETPETPSHLEIVEIGVDAAGRFDLVALDGLLTEDVAAVYLENPAFNGQIEAGAAAVGEAAHRVGAAFIVGVDPISLGVIAPPSSYGADIVVGSIQPLGVHMHCGGGLGGFIASRDEECYARQYPTLQVSIGKTDRDEYGFGMSLMHQSSYGSREEGNDWTGNSTYLWAVASAVYMALMGPEGFREVGEGIVRRAAFAASLIGAVPGVSVAYDGGFFKEFIVNFDGTGKTVAEINRRLLDARIFGGLDLSEHFPEYGQSALYCVTELHDEADLRRLADVLEGACAR